MADEEFDESELDEGEIDQDFGVEDLDLGTANSDDEDGEQVSFSDLPLHKQVRVLFPVVFRSQWGDVSAEDKQPILFEASSFISTVIDNHLLTWESGIQVPLLLYLTETLVRRLKRNGWSLIVVFFDTFRAKQWPSPSHALAARVIEHHLRHVLSGVVYNEDVGACSLSDDVAVSVHDFPSWRNERWEKFLHDVHPAFVIVAPPTSAERTREREAEDVDTAAATMCDLKCLFIMELLSQRVRCVTSDFNFNDLRVATFSLIDTARLALYDRDRYDTLVHRDAAPAPAADHSPVALDGVPQEVAESVQFAADAIVLALQGSPQDAMLCKFYLLHVILARQLSLKDRAVSDAAIANFPGKEQAVTFLQSLERTLCACFPEPRSPLRCFTSADVLDGRLFLAVLSVLNSGSVSAIDGPDALGAGSSQWIDALEPVWAKCAAAAGCADTAFFPLTATATGDVAEDATVPDALSLEEKPFCVSKTPYATALVASVDEQLKERGVVCESADSLMMAPQPSSEFRYNHQNTLTDERQMKPEAMNGRQKRAHMKQYAFMKKFASTLSSNLLVTNVVTARSDGLGLQPAADDDADEEEEEAAPAKGGKKAKKAAAGKKGQRGGKGAKGASRKDEIIKQNKARLSQADVEKVKIAIDTASTEREIRDRIQRLADRLRALRKSGATQMALVSGYITLIEWCLEEWGVEREDARLTRRDPADIDYTAAINAFRLTYDVLDFFAKDTEPEQMRSLQKGLCQLGFKKAARELYKRYVALKGDAVKKEAVFDPRKEIFENLDVDMTFTRFQLNFTGHLMQRSFDSKDDPRVNGFQPDAWQRVLMDTVDAKNSALVVAPTSSGKTFVSYYTMKQVLEDNKFKQQPRSRRRKDAVKQEKDTKYGIVVYICPTKALVNQVAAEVYHRYGPVVGVLTKEYSQSINNCQVLVTLPSMLESILLTPIWVKLLRYVILDEVHCIQGTTVSLDAETGATWEHVIDMLPCPFVALSATVGNPESFHGWLQQTQKKYGRDVALIVHPHRWGDLKLSVYCPPQTPEDHEKRTKFTGTLSRPATSGLRSLHPIACISVSDIVHVGALEVVSMSPDECVTLYDAMAARLEQLKRRDEAAYAQVCEVVPEADMKALNPDKHFKESNIILRYDVYKYECKLKAAVKKLCCSEAGAALFESVILYLAGEDQEAGTLSYPCGPKFTEEYMMPLLVELMSKNKLPALLFSLNRHMCTRMACQIIRELVEAEEVDRQRPEFQNRLRDIERMNKQLEKQAKRKRDKEEEAGAKDPFQAEEPTMLTRPDEKPDDKFSFIPPKKRMYGEDRDYWENRIRWKCNCSEPLMATLMQGLDRGVGVHHAGLPHPYRLAVEVLFRAGHLQVLFATGTLAMGINMPARTVCFFDDSGGLTPLLYRQMSGRAGRRGYDDVGHVVFCSLPKHRVHSLVSSKLTTVTGFQPVSPTLALRTIISYSENDSTQRQDVAAFFQGLLEPALYTNNIVDEQRRAIYSRHSLVLFRVYLEFLRRMRFVDAELKPVGLGSMAAALHMQEPANFSFCYLLASGHVDAVCAGFRQDNEGTARRLLHLLCHVFNPVPVPEGLQVPETQDENTSQVLLAPLPDDLAASLASYEQMVMRTFASAIEAAAPVPPSAADEQLPISSRTFSSTQSEASPEEGTVLSALKKAAPRNSALSPFATLSSTCAASDSPRALADTARPGLLADASQVPLTLLTDASGRRFRLNAAVLDYYRLVSKQKIVRENGFKEEVAWELLNQWNKLIDAIHTSLKTMVVHPLNNLALQTFEYLAAEFQKKFDRFNEVKA